ncbi:DUF429 domain-containing protein [Salinicoccus albus]|uniref:DUF429 domain-containing protein n=1 Tax=Salinicoccus albus TaxID=418756 RepID=UPI0003AA4A40|nr:DUF429 domain-containing protein [Salinicoccus albus]
MIFIGIDLAWTYQNETGVCVIGERGKVEYLDAQVYSNDEIIDIVKSYDDKKLCIAIDAPLIVNNEGGSRTAERELMKSKIHGHRLFAFQSNRTFLTNTFGEIRGETLMGMILDALPEVTSGEDPFRSGVVETFPTGICCGLFPEIFPVKYKRKPKVPFEETLKEMQRLRNRFKALEDKENLISGFVSQIPADIMNIDRKMHKHMEDKIDAFLCAFGMYSIYNEIAQMKKFGSDAEGVIVIPVKIYP